jgi:hypothetical protein
VPNFPRSTFLDYRPTVGVGVRILPVTGVEAMYPAYFLPKLVYSSICRQDCTREAPTGVASMLTDWSAQCNSTEEGPFKLPVNLLRSSRMNTHCGTYPRDLIVLHRDPIERVAPNEKE